MRLDGRKCKSTRIEQSGRYGKQAWIRTSDNQGSAFSGNIIEGERLPTGGVLGVKHDAEDVVALFRARTHTLRHQLADELNVAVPAADGFSKEAVIDSLRDLFHLWNLTQDACPDGCPL